MAEILVKAIDNSSPDPEIDAGCYKVGDPVLVMPDGHPWGREEGPPKFYLLKCPGMSMSDASFLFEPAVAREPDGTLRRISRRRWTVSLSPSEQTIVATSGQLNLSKTRLMAVSADKEAFRIKEKAR